MASIFSSPQSQTPAPLPKSPIEDEYRLYEQEQAQRRASADLAASGRRTTEFAGREIAMRKQAVRAGKRASSESLGL
jgi:hypothetical protein